MRQAGRWGLAMAGWLAVAGAACADDAAPVGAVKPAMESATRSVPAEAIATAAPIRSASSFLSSVPVVQAAPKPNVPAARGVVGSLAVGTAKPADYPDLAKIQMQYAIRAAMTRVQGKLLRAGLEAAGGSLVWEIGIVKTDHTIFAVKVDAGNGAVLSVDHVESGEDHP